MRLPQKRAPLLLTGVSLFSIIPGLCLAAESVDDRLSNLERALAKQSEVIAEQQQILDLQGRKLNALGDLRGRGVTPEAPSGASSANPSQAASGTNAATPAADTAAGPSSGPVGTPPPPSPDQGKPPPIQSLADQGGVLTHKGHLVIEPSVDYVHASQNQFTFRGVQIQEVVLLGVIEAQSASRDLISPAMTLRYGLTNRLEMEVKVPYVYRTDRLTFNIPEVNTNISQSSSLSGSGIGDIEVAAHYQINDGANHWPFFIGNLRLKTATGTGPYDVARDSNGVETEDPTGSGYWTVEPSVTVIYPTAPAVLFANVAYDFNMGYNPNATIGTVQVNKVEPGDAIGVAVGMGFAVNDELSYSLGYKHQFFMKTRTSLTDLQTGAQTVQDQSSQTIGTLLFGLSLKTSETTHVNLNFQLGITNDAPDVDVTLSVPMDFGPF